MTARRATGPVSARQVTAALRGLFPHAAVSCRAAEGGQVRVRLPGVSADELGVAQPDSAGAAAWLSEKLGVAVQVRWPRDYQRPGWGRFVEFFVTAQLAAQPLEVTAGPAAGQRRAGPVREIIAAGGGAAPAGTGLLLRWAGASPARGADVVTADGEMRGFLVADGHDPGGGQLFAAYRVEAGVVVPACRAAGVPASLAALLGAPAPPHTGYATRVPVRRAVAREPGAAGRTRVPGGNGTRTGFTVTSKTFSGAGLPRWHLTSAAGAQFIYFTAPDGEPGAVQVAGVEQYPLNKNGIPFRLAAAAVADWEAEAGKEPR